MEATGMEAVVSSITTTLSAANLWGIVGNVVPLLGIVILFALGFGLVMRLVNRLKSHE